MKILIVGYGSIGKRHVENLLKLNQNNLIVCTNNKNTKKLKKIGIHVTSNLDESIKQFPDVAFICNETSKHVDTALKLAKNNCHLFIEKPLSHSLKGIKELEKISNEKKIISMIGCNLRFHQCIEKIKSLIEKNEIGRIISAQAESGSFLPDWHPGEDYRSSYASNKQLGGGVILTCIHELDYFMWMFGDVLKVSSFSGKYSNLDINAEDLSAILLEHKNHVIGEIHLDFFQQPDVRKCKIIGEKGTIFWNSINNEVIVYKNKPKKHLVILKIGNYDRNLMYLKEIDYFLKCVRNNKNSFNSIADAIRTLKVALCIKQSSISNRHLAINY